MAELGVDLFHLAGGFAAGLQYSFTATQLAILGIIIVGLLVFWGAILWGNITDRQS